VKIVPVPVELQNGLLGTEQLVSYITRLIDEGAMRSDVRELALRVVKLARPQDATAEIQAVWDYLTGITAPPYRMDPVDLQLLTWPEAIETLNAYDCKKISIVAGALLQALGHEVKVRVIDQRPQTQTRAANYHHVYLRVFNKDLGQWVTFDPVARSWRHPSATVGSELTHNARRTYMVRVATQYDNGYTRGGRGVGFDLYADLLKYVDPTRPENTALHSLLSLTPLAPVVVAADAVAAAQKAANAAAAANKPTQTATPRPPITTSTARPPTASTTSALTQATRAPLSTGAKIAIVAASAGVVAGIVYLATRRKTNPRRKRSTKGNAKKATRKRKVA